MQVRGVRLFKCWWACSLAVTQCMLANCCRRCCVHAPPYLPPPPALAACADEQVRRLLAALNISPAELPSEGPGLASNWDQIYRAAAPRLAQPSAASEHAAAVAAAAAQEHQQQWAQEFERLRLGAEGPSSSASWAAEYHNQQQQQAGQPAGWAEEFAQGEEAATNGAGWVNEFRSTAAAGSALRQRAAGDALEQTKKLADTLAGGWRRGAACGCCPACGWGCRAAAQQHGSLTQQAGTAARALSTSPPCASSLLLSPRCPPLVPGCSQPGPQDPGQQVPSVCEQDEPGGADPGGQPGGRVSCMGGGGGTAP